MQNGIHRNSPASEVASFRKDLILQASSDGVTLDIQQGTNPDGTVTVAWKVLPAGADTHLQSASPPAGPQAVAVDPQALIVRAQGAVSNLLQQTSNAASQQDLRSIIGNIGQILSNLPAAVGQAAVNALNDLVDQLAAATKAANADPLSPVAVQMRDTGEQIGNALGATGHQLRGGIAEPPPTPPEDASGGASSAPPAAADQSPVQPGGLLRSNGIQLFTSCVTRPERVAEVQSVCNLIIKNASRYQEVSDALGGTIPWFLIGIIHSLESSFSFTTHLHNGDPLTARTVHSPVGRPVQGSPPFSWKDSACDALRLKHLDRVTDWPLAVMLDRLERYNGVGYVAEGINSPYLWSFSQQWTKGKFVRDGVFDPNAGSNQCGGAVALKHLVDVGAVKLSGTKRTPSADSALGHQTPMAAAQFMPPSAQTELAFPGPLKLGSTMTDGTKRVQEWCGFHGAPTPIDGAFGSGTQAAVTLFQNQSGIPATGIVDLRTWAALTAPIRAVLAPLRVTPASLNDAVVAVARQHVAQKPIELGGDNKGPWVKLYMDGKDGIEDEWCAGFACFVIEQAAQALGVAMPFPRRVAVAELIADAKQSNRFIAGGDIASPAAAVARLKPGGLFVVKNATQSHTGILVEVRGDGFSSAEGNATNVTNSNRGFEAIIQNRSYPGKDFILLA